MDRYPSTLPNAGREGLCVGKGEGRFAGDYFQIRTLCGSEDVDRTSDDLGVVDLVTDGLSHTSNS